MGEKKKVRNTDLHWNEKGVQRSSSNKRIYNSINLPKRRYTQLLMELNNKKEFENLELEAHSNENLK